VTANAALSQPLIEEQQRLDFGTLAITENISVSRFNFPRSGNNITIEGQFVLIERGTPGRYGFSGFPANTSLTVTLNDTNLTAGTIGVPEQFSVDNYDFINLITDSEGDAELTLGARLSTTGNGGGYVDALYDGTTVLRVEYWQPDIGSYVFNSRIIELEVEQRSTLNMSQEQQLNFGTLFARTSNTGQAVLTLSRTGTYTIDEPNNSRLVSLLKPEQGIIRVSGAAPNQSLTITSQVDDVLLEHTDGASLAPHFILSDLVTFPEGTGMTDVNGELLITIGGTLKTELTALPTTYPSGQYQGTYQITVSY